MSTITTIASGDNISNSRTDINTNFANLNADKMETSVLDTDTALTANSDSKVATQKAVKAYVDAGGNVNASTTGKGIVEEATDAEVTAGTATGGTGARLFVNPSSVRSMLTWQLIASTTSASGEYAVTGLGSYNRILIVLKAVTSSVADGRTVVVSSNGGSSYYTGASDYNSSTAITLTGGSTSAQDSFCIIENFNSVTYKPSMGKASPYMWLINRTEAMNAVKVGTANINGGSIYVYGM